MPSHAERSTEERSTGEQSTPETSTAEPTIAEAGSDDAAKRLWEEATRRHDTVLSAYGAYELDPAMMMTYPAVTDVTLDHVQAFQHALSEANALRTDRFPADLARAEAYQLRVRTLVTSWTACESAGRRLGTAHLDDTDKADLGRALKLYRHADRGTTAEEQAAYLNRARDIVGTLVDRGSLHPPQATIAELDSMARRMIGPGHSAQPVPPQQDVADPDGTAQNVPDRKNSPDTE